MLSTFLTVLVAEIGDKTQLTTFAISASSNRPVAVFLGSVFAVVLASLLGSLAGGSIAVVIPSEIFQLLASIGFLTIGFRLLWPLHDKQKTIIPSTDT